MQKMMMKYVVQADWVASKLGKIQLIDASWHMPAANRSGFKEFCKERLPGAAFFDLDECCDKTSSLPHMMPSPAIFSEYMGNIGINSESPIIVYDSISNFSAPRLWWMLQSMGMKQSAVLDGGLRSWKAGQYPLETHEPAKPTVAKFEARAIPGRFTELKSLASTVRAMSKLEYRHVDEKLGYIIDARSAARFNGEVDEPRAGLRRGHIPHSMNIPWDSILDEKTGKFLPENEIKDKFKKSGVLSLDGKQTKLTFSCGSGVTACVPLLAAAHYENYPLENISVYDGAWSEWGGLHDSTVYPAEVTAKVEIQPNQ